MDEHRPLDPSFYEARLERERAFPVFEPDVLLDSIATCDEELEHCHSRMADETCAAHWHNAYREHHDVMLAERQVSMERLAAHTAQAITAQTGQQLVQPARAAHEIAPVQEAEHE